MSQLLEINWIQFCYTVFVTLLIVIISQWNTSMKEFQRNFTELILQNRKIKAKRHKTTCNIYGIAGEKTCYL